MLLIISILIWILAVSALPINPTAGISHPSLNVGKIGERTTNIIVSPVIPNEQSNSINLENHRESLNKKDNLRDYPENNTTNSLCSCLKRLSNETSGCGSLKTSCECKKQLILNSTINNKHTSNAITVDCSQKNAFDPGGCCCWVPDPTGAHKWGHVLDLGKVVEISSISFKIKPGCGDCNCHTSGYYYYSEDGKIWKLFWTEANLAGWTVYSRTANINGKARYFRANTDDCSVDYAEVTAQISDDQIKVNSITPNEISNLIKTPISLKIRGSGFKKGATVKFVNQTQQLSFNADSTTVTSSSIISSKIKNPSKITAALYDVIVINPDKKQGSLEKGLNITEPIPTILQISPNIAIENQLITIKGKNFGTDKNKYNIKIFDRVDSQSGAVNWFTVNKKSISKWTNTLITLKIPKQVTDINGIRQSGVSSGALFLERLNDGVKSNYAKISILYTTKEWKWGISSIDYYIDSNSITNSRFISAIQSAAKKWSSIIPSRIKLNYKGTIANSKNPTEDQKNIVYLKPLKLGVHGITYPKSYSGHISDSDIVLNSLDTWVIANAQIGQENIEAVILHEFGHFLGLGDVYGDLPIVYPKDWAGYPSDLSPTMKVMYGLRSANPNYNNRNLIKLSYAEINGLKSIYK